MSAMAMTREEKVEMFRASIVAMEGMDFDSSAEAHEHYHAILEAAAIEGIEMAEVVPS